MTTLNFIHPLIVGTSKINIRLIIKIKSLDITLNKGEIIYIPHIGGTVFNL